MSAVPARSGRVGTIAGELAKLPAFVRRDVHVMLSYRVAFVSDLLNLLLQGVLFALVSGMIDERTVPQFGRGGTSYLEFVTIGIAVSAFVGVGVGRVSAVLRGEQVMGTLESLVATPTSTSTIQLGSVAFDLLYVPLRLAVFLAIMAVGFGVSLDAGGVLPAMLLFAAFMPFVWGLGVMAAGVLLVVRRGAGMTGLLGSVLGLLSGAYVPVTQFPEWMQSLSEGNPVAVVLDAMREVLLGGAGWATVAGALPLLVGASVLALAMGAAVFELALRHERKNGTLGIY